MKNLHFFSGTLIAFVFAIVPFQLLAQDTISEELRVKEWIDGQTITVFDHPIKRVFGETYDKNSIRNYHIPVTNIGYKDLSQLQEEVKQTSKTENWSEEKYKTELLNLDSLAPGGRLYVYIERKVNDRTKLNYFFVVFRDADDQEFYRSGAESREPEFGDFGFWSNYFTLDIPVEVDYPFFVYVNDRQSSNLSDFKFEVFK